VGTGSDCRSTSAGVGRGLGEGHGESGRDNGNNNANGESHEAPLLGPPSPPSPLPPLMTPTEMMAEMLVARQKDSLCLGDDGTGSWWLHLRRPQWQRWERGWCPQP
jgi:hypothetical protein